MPQVPPDNLWWHRLDPGANRHYSIHQKGGRMEQNEEMGWGDDWFAQPWDEEEYEADPEREWERVTWVEDLLVPLDSIESVR